MDCRARVRLAYPADHRPHERQDVEPLGSPQTLFSCRRDSGVLALLVMPNSPAVWVAAGMLWIMDASINVTMQPFRAFIGDMLPDEQRDQGICRSNLLHRRQFRSSLRFCPGCSRNVSILPTPRRRPDTSFGEMVLLYRRRGVLARPFYGHIFSVKEYSPEEQEAFNVHETDAAAKEGAELSSNRIPILYFGVRVLLICGLIFTLSRKITSSGIKDFISCRSALPFTASCRLAAAKRYSLGKIGGLVEIIYDLNNMPKTMRQLALVTVFTWFALFALFIYTTSGGDQLPLRQHAIPRQSLQ